MDIKKLGNLRHELLTELEAEFQKQLVPAKVSGGPEEPVEVLTVLLADYVEDGLTSSAEFFFLPNKEDDELQFFVNLVTIAQDIAADRLNELCTAIAFINTYVIAGAFALDAAANTLVYKHSYEMPIDLDGEKIRDNLDIAMGVAMKAVQEYGYLLVSVNEGRRTAESVIELLLQSE